MLGTITTFANRFSRQGKRLSIRWERLFDRFEDAPIASSKDDLPLWSPAIFANDSRADGSSVDTVFALVLDFDHGGSLEHTIDVFGDHYGAIHTTFSHSDEEHRFRCVLPFEEPINADRYAQVWRAAEARCHSAALFPDPATKNASRIWFVPARRPGLPFVARRLEGAVLDPEQLVARWRPPTPAAPIARAPTPYESRDRVLYRASTYLARMPASVSGQGGHNALCPRTSRGCRRV